MKFPLSCCVLFFSSAFLSSDNNVDAFMVRPSFSTKSAIRKGKSSASSSSIAYSNNDEEDNEPWSEEKRMKYVRSFQKTYYENNDNQDNTISMNKRTGLIKNLPLWRVGWVELPGRANCLNVYESQYTHMFETILNAKSGDKEDLSSEGPWYVGHLHLPGGFKSAQNSIDRRFELKTWKEEIKDETRRNIDDENDTRPPERSAVIGTLMRISDFRRMEDGRLTFLVHPIERFVVTEVKQHFPYSVADVQLLPDIDNDNSNSDDNNRSKAVSETFQFLEYEHDISIKLPLPTNEEYVSQEIDVSRMNKRDLSKILPFAFYSNDDSTLDMIEDEHDLKSEIQQQLKVDVEEEISDIDLEERLENNGILSMPPFIAGPVSINRRSENIDELERLLWLAMDEFCEIAQFSLPEEILCLLPPHILKDITKMKPLPSERTSINFVNIEKYPAHRRQRRLSYSAPALLESLMKSDQMSLRQMCLCIPSTRQRLAVVLERFELVNDLLLQNQKPKRDRGGGGGGKSGSSGGESGNRRREEGNGSGRINGMKWPGDNNDDNTGNDDENLGQFE